MWAGNLVRARLLARKGIVDPTDFTSLLAWRLESNVSDVPDVPDVPADEYSWEGVAYHINNGTYKDVYAIGDMIPLDLGTEGIINMQIAAFDADALADGSGTAAISWVAKELLATVRRMNGALSGTTEGTGSIGGWEKCEMRAYLQDTIKPLIPKVVRSQIVAVAKTQNAYDTSNASVSQTTTDEVWIPATAEFASSGSIYNALMPDASSRAKTIANTTTAHAWWARNSGNNSNFRSIAKSGVIAKTDATSQYGVCLGFCVGRTPT